MIEWKTIGDVIEYLPGGALKRNEVMDEGLYPVMNGGIDYSGFYEKYNYDENVLTISHWGSSASHVHRHYGKFWANNACWVFLPKDCSKCKLVYLYYLLKSREQIMMQTMCFGGATPNLNRGLFEKMSIPIPAPSEQARIVEILDTFTSSIENLKQQISERRKQYEYYRDQLLDLEGKEGVEMKTLGECVVLITDGDHQPPPKSEEGIPFITISNIEKSSHKIDFTNSFYVPKEYYNSLKDDKKPRIGDVLYTVTGSFGIPVLIQNDIAFCFQRHIALIRPNNTIATSQYIFHWLRTGFAIKQGEEKASGGAQKTVSLNSLRGFRFYYPSLQEQSRIVSILDTFEASIANLEAQLKQREKQYEYYRNKLLTFE